MVRIAAAQETTDRLRERAQVRWTQVPRQVLAFYYGWYANQQVSGRWFHWSDVDSQKQRIGNATHYPALGAYDSHDPALVEQHCRWAAQAGLSGFIVSWWAQGDFHDQGLPLLLDAAQRSGLSITAYFETVHPDNAPTPAGALQDVLYLLQRYGSHPAWLKVNGKPVLFIYGRAVGQIGTDGWLWVITEANRRYPGGAVFIGDQISQSAAHVFDGIHTYNVTGSTAGKSADAVGAWARATFPQWVQTAGSSRIACLTVIPGYDDSTLGRALPRPITDRSGGRSYRVLWEEATAARPDWILVTSWNEWHEGTEIEPSVENGQRELLTTAELAPKFRSLAPRSPAGAISDAEWTALRDRLQKLPMAVLPNSASDASWSLLQLGLSPAALTWEQIVNPQVFNPRQYPIALYAGGETYTATVRDTDDVPRALSAYVAAGGILAVLPSQPVPFYYDASRPTASGSPTAVHHDRLIGMPLTIAWERPPSDNLSFAVVNPGLLPHMPPQFPFPSAGDLRWRPLARSQVPAGTVVSSLIDLRDPAGNSLGDGCVLLRQGKGAILYAWFRLLDIPEGEALLFDVWQLLAQQAAGG